MRSWPFVKHRNINAVLYRNIQYKQSTRLQLSNTNDTWPVYLRLKSKTPAKCFYVERYFPHTGSISVLMHSKNTKHLRWQVKIGSDNGPLPSGNRLLHEPMATQFISPYSVTRSHWVKPNQVTFAQADPQNKLILWARYKFTDIKKMYFIHTDTVEPYTHQTRVIAHERNKKDATTLLLSRCFVSNLLSCF